MKQVVLKNGRTAVIREARQDDAEELREQSSALR